MIPCIPGFAGDLRSDAAMGTRAIMDYQYKSICRGQNSIYGQLREQGVDPKKYIFAFNLRSYDRINKTPELKRIEEESGVHYHDVQRAQAEEIMGEGLHGVPGENKKKKRDGRRAAAMNLSKGQPTDLKGLAKRNAEKEVYEGSSESESDLDEEAERPPRPADNISAAEKKRRFEERRHDVGLEDHGKSETVLSSDSIAKDAMLGGKKVSEENYAGRAPGKGVEGSEDEEEAREQEKENFVQEQLYIHGKVGY